MGRCCNNGNRGCCGYNNCQGNYPRNYGYYNNCNNYGYGYGNGGFGNCGCGFGNGWFLWPLLFLCF